MTLSKKSFEQRQDTGRGGTSREVLINHTYKRMVWTIHSSYMWILFLVSHLHLCNIAAVTEMLLSQAQISAPLLQFFPQAWQRALLGNIITLSTAVISDFFDGLQFQILGYQLSFSFKPITQEDMINHLGFGRANDRSGKLADFEAAVRATAQDIAEELKFLDRWHERALGSGILRTQIANLIARVVLALVDDILCDSHMNLWSAHAGGPRIIAGLEYRTQASKVTEDLETE